MHLAENSIPVETARGIVGDSLLIGRSVHSVEAALDASRAGADVLVFGTVFATASHPGRRPGGVGPLRELSRHHIVPVLGIGGITPGNAGDVVGAGASGAAVITAITESPNPEEAARAMKQTMMDAWTQARFAEGALV